jgi:hypothetical protein
MKNNVERTARNNRIALNDIPRGVLSPQTQHDCVAGQRRQKSCTPILVSISASSRLLRPRKKTVENGVTLRRQTRFALRQPQALSSV